MELRTKILEAVARGWCHPKNSAKEMDSDLASAITDEVMATLTSPLPTRPTVAHSDFDPGISS